MGSTPTSNDRKAEAAKASASAVYRQRREVSWIDELHEGQRIRLGLLIGPAGSGKTTTLEVIADECMAQGHAVLECSGSTLPDTARLSGYDVVLIDDAHTLSQDQLAQLASVAADRHAPTSILAAILPQSALTLVDVAGKNGTLSEFRTLSSYEQALLLADVGRASEDAEDLAIDSAGNPQLFELAARDRDQAAIDAVVRQRLSSLTPEQRRALVQLALHPGSVEAAPLLASGLIDAEGAVAALALGELGRSVDAETVRAAVESNADTDDPVRFARVVRALGVTGNAAETAYLQAGLTLFETNIGEADTFLAAAGHAGAGYRAYAAAASGRTLEARELLETADHSNDLPAQAAMALLAAGRSDWADAARMYSGLGNHLLPGSPISADRLADLCRLVAGAGAGAGASTSAGDTALDDAIELLEQTVSSEPAEDLDDRLRSLARSSADLDPSLASPLGPMELAALAALASSQFTTAFTLLDSSPESPSRSPITNALGEWIRTRSATNVQLKDTAAAGEHVPIAAQVLKLARLSAVSRDGRDLDASDAVMNELVRLGSQLPVDLLVLDALSELVTTAHRLDRRAEAHRIGHLIERFVARLGDPYLWASRVRYTLVEAAVLSGDRDAVMSAADRVEQIAESQASTRPLAQAAVAWRTAIDGAANVTDIRRAADDLRTLGLDREAEFLVGQAAIRATDPKVATTLLASGAPVITSPAPATKSQALVSVAGLSTREIEIGKRILDGDSYREIADGCYISIKTVEHHVGHIRQKLLMVGKRRAEFKAALRADFGIE